MQIAHLLLSNLLFLLIAVSCTGTSGNKAYIDENDLIPEQPPFWTYFTMYGVDSDNDRVRDDVELWINTKFEDRNTRLAAKSWVKINLELLEAADEQNRFLELKKEAEVRSKCLNFVLGPNGITEAVHLKSQLYDALYNNFWRHYRIDKAYRNVPAEVYAIPMISFYENGIGCRFKIQNVWNIIDGYLKKHPNVKFSDQDKAKAKDIYEDNPSNYDAIEMLSIRKR